MKRLNKFPAAPSGSLVKAVQKNIEVRIKKVSPMKKKHMLLVLANPALYLVWANTFVGDEILVDPC